MEEKYIVTTCEKLTDVVARILEEDLADGGSLASAWSVVDGLAEAYPKIDRDGFARKAGLLRTYRVAVLKEYDVEAASEEGAGREAQNGNGRLVSSSVEYAIEKN